MKASYPFVCRMLGAVLVCLSVVPSLVAAGNVDAAFNPGVNGIPGTVVVQPDGKIVIDGQFTGVGGTARNSLARLNTDGTLDTSFVPALNDIVFTAVVLADGRLLVGGQFTTASGATHNRLARLYLDGSADATFSPSLNGIVYAAALQIDGKILVGGTFFTVNGATHNYLARLNADGTPDNTFNPSFNDSVGTIVVQSDGKILVLGAFTYVNNTPRSYVARLNADGTLDTSLVPTLDYPISAVAYQSDGKLLAGGQFTKINGATYSHVARFNTDGSLDNTFYPYVNGSVNSISLQADGRIVLGGFFSSINGSTQTHLARLNADGSVDLSFVASAPGPDNTGVFGTTLQGDGAVLIAGNYSSVNGTARTGLARVFNDPATFRVVGTGGIASYTVRFLDGGTLPEAQQVSFDASSNNGATYTTPVYGTRIAGGWQATIPLPAASGLVRVRLRPVGGNNSGLGLVQMIGAYPTPDIVLEQPAGSPLIDSVTTTDFAETALGTKVTRTYTIRNVGAGTLRVGDITLDGANPYDFSVNTGATISAVTSGNTTTFDVTFAPVNVSYLRSAVLHVASNANGSNNPFDIKLIGLGLSSTSSLGNDGLNDHAKFLLAALGFDWTQSQPSLVQTYFNGANAAGLYTAAQVQDLNVGVPLLQKEAGTGQFKLTVAVQQSADLRAYTPLSLATGSLSVNQAGALEFRFNSQTGAAFYRLQSQ